MTSPNILAPIDGKRPRTMSVGRLTVRANAQVIRVEQRAGKTLAVTEIQRFEFDQFVRWYTTPGSMQ